GGGDRGAGAAGRKAGAAFQASLTLDGWSEGWRDRGIEGWRGATSGGSTRARPPGLILGVAFRSHRSRPLALLAQPAYNGSPRRNAANPKFRPRGLRPRTPSRGGCPCTPLSLDCFSAGDAPATPSVPEGRSRCGRGSG